MKYVGALLVGALGYVLWTMKKHPTCTADLQRLMPESVIEIVGDRREIVVYTGWSALDDDRGTFILMGPD